MTAAPPPAGFVGPPFTGWEILFPLGVIILSLVIVCLWFKIERYIADAKDAPRAKH